MLQLPTYQELSEEQDSVYNLPTNGKYLVVGPPGTGKTVMALYRAHQVNGAEHTAQLLVYNRPLERYLRQALQKLDLEGNAPTFHKWLHKWCVEHFRLSYPKFP